MRRLKRENDMNLLLSHDISLKKVLRRAILEKNVEMEHLDWLNLVFKLNPSERNTISVISVRPLDKTKYHQGTAFKFAKLQLEQLLKDEILLSDYINLNNLSNKKFSEVRQHLMPIINGKHFVQNALILDMSDVQHHANVDKEMNVSLVRRLPNKKLVEVDYDSRPTTVRSMLDGTYYLHIYAGENHPLFYGEKHILLK